MIPSFAIFLIGIMTVAMIAIVIFFERKSSKDKTQTIQQPAGGESIKSSIILNSIGDGVFLTDENDVIQLFNPSAGRITGWIPEEATGLDYKLVIKLQNEKGEEYQESNSPFSQSLNSMSSIQDEHAYLLTKSKKNISIDITVTPLFDEQEYFQGYIAVFRDVTAKRKEEQERTDFISTASHEMRTPVAAIEGYLALALNEKVSTIDDKARGFLNRAHENSKHLGRLFRDLLASSQADDGRLESNPVVVEMGELMTGLVSDLQMLASSKDLAVDFVMGDDKKVIREGKGVNMIKPLYYAHIDPNRITEAVNILFDNAIKYTDSGKITVGLTGDESIIQIRVEDTGIGIASENLHHLFQKFYRVDNTTTRTNGGTGLGLFIAKKIIEMYDGRIWAESELGKGSSFFINIPRISSTQADQIKSSIKDPQVINPQTGSNVT